ncbi:MAG: VWA domain-containing protein [Actinobacteria bacterium]|nr:VWA domain-containing protein [Actinomycetota bacterium]
MRFFTRLLAGTLAVAGAGLLAALPANADPVGVDDVIAALGLQPEPATYVVLADTSGSMNADGRYANMRSELGKLVDSLDPRDSVSLMTFDTKVTSRFQGVVGDNRSAVLAGLPASASGLHTDIGRAIEAGLDAMEKSSAQRQVALILITDGDLDAPGSPYEDPKKSSAWKKLKTRATALGATHQVAAYAVSLMAATDAGLLKTVFPNAREVAPEQVGARFAQVGTDLLKLQAAAALKDEVAQNIGVRWTGDLGASLANGRPVDVQLDFTSPYPHVPVVLSDLTVQAPPGVRVELSDLPKSVTLEPGGTATVHAKAVVTGTGGGNVNVGLTATANSSWKKALDAMGLKFAPAIDGAAPVPAAPITLPPNLLPLVGGIAGLVAAAVAVLLLARLLLTPSMSGVLAFRRDGRDLADVVLGGRRMKLVAPVAATDLTGLSGTATGARASGGNARAVRIDARFGAAAARGLVVDGGTIALGDLEITYVSGRRRILDKIGVARTPELVNAVDGPPNG